MLRKSKVAGSWQMKTDKFYLKGILSHCCPLIHIFSIWLSHFLQSCCSLIDFEMIRQFSLAPLQELTFILDVSKASQHKRAHCFIASQAKTSKLLRLNPLWLSGKWICCSLREMGYSVPYQQIHGKEKGFSVEPMYFIKKRREVASVWVPIFITKGCDVLTCELSKLFLFYFSFCHT